MHNIFRYTEPFWGVNHQHDRQTDGRTDRITIATACVWRRVLQPNLWKLFCCCCCCWPYVATQCWTLLRKTSGLAEHRDNYWYLSHFLCMSTVPQASTSVVAKLRIYTQCQAADTRCHGKKLCIAVSSATPAETINDKWTNWYNRMTVQLQPSDDTGIVWKDVAQNV